MKKNIPFLTIFIFCISVSTSWAVEECFITWQGDSSGIISTTETSRTNQAAEELYDAIYSGYSGNALWFVDGCYGEEIVWDAEYSQQIVCMDGTWHWEYWELECGPYACVEEGGTWDVVCGPDNDIDNDGTPDFLDNDTIYGTVSGDVQEGVTVEIYRTNCGGDVLIAETDTDQNGYYSFGGLENGQLLIVPTAGGYSFVPVRSWPNIPQIEIQSYDFTATKLTCSDVYRFLDNGDGTVIDCHTDLIWLKNAVCYGEQDYYNTMSLIAELNSGECGLSDGSVEGDWHLTTLLEFQAIGTDPPRTWGPDGTTDPSWTFPVSHFPNVPSDGIYWTNTGAFSTMTNEFMFVLPISTGVMNTARYLEQSAYVWPVRYDN